MKRKKTIDCFSENLAAFSYNHDLTIPKMCELLNISPSTISMWRKGKAFPRIEVLEKLADYFDISVAELLTDYELEDSTTITLRKNDFTKNELKEIQDYIDFIKIRRALDNPKQGERVTLRGNSIAVLKYPEVKSFFNKKNEKPAAESSAPSDQDE